MGARDVWDVRLREPELIALWAAGRVVLRLHENTPKERRGNAHKNLENALKRIDVVMQVARRR